MPLVSTGSCGLPDGGGGGDGSEGTVIGGSVTPVSGTDGAVVLIGVDGVLGTTEDDVGL